MNHVAGRSGESPGRRTARPGAHLGLSAGRLDAAGRRVVAEGTAGLGRLVAEGPARLRAWSGLWSAAVNRHVVGLRLVRLRWLPGGPRVRLRVGMLHRLGGGGRVLHLGRGGTVVTLRPRHVLLCGWRRMRHRRRAVRHRWRAVWLLRRGVLLGWRVFGFSPVILVLYF